MSSCLKKSNYLALSIYRLLRNFHVLMNEIRLLLGLATLQARSSTIDGIDDPP
jgi:hypothetical protein